MKARFQSPKRRAALAVSLILFTGVTATAATYQWNGSSNSDWATAANWTAAGVAPTGTPPPPATTWGHRLNINNGTATAPANEAIYTADLGETIYGSNSDRGLVIGSSSSGSAYGSMRITGGTFSTAGNTTDTTKLDVLGNGGNSVGILTIDGGNFVGGVSNFSMGLGGGPACTLTLTENGGSFKVPNLVLNNTTGTVNLNGGTLAVNSITRSNGSNTINLNGGTLKARVTSPTFIGNLAGTTVRVKSGGAIIDTSGDADTGVNVTIGLPLLEDPASPGGGLTKNGPGTLTLTGVNTFTGGIIITDGTLALSPASAYTYNGTIGGGGDLSISGAGPVLLGGTLTPDITLSSGAGFGGEGSTAGELVFNGNNTFYFNPGTSGADGHFRAALIDASWATVNFLATAGSGTASGVVVMEATDGQIYGEVGTNFIGTSRINLYLNDGNTKLLADFTPGALVWRGNDAINPTYWDNETTINWFNNTTSSADKFFPGDAVRFDDTAESSTVVIQGSVVPGSVIFSNDEATYFLSGGPVAGAGTLAVSGPGVVNLNATNTYSGGTTLNDGIVNAPVSTALGTGPVTVNTGAELNLTSTTNGDFGYTGIANALSGAGTVNVSLGTGTATRLFNGDNSGFTGTLNIGVGAVGGAGKAQILGNLGADATVHVLENATVYVSGASVNHPASIILDGGDTGEVHGQLRLDAGATWSGTVTLSGDITGTGDGILGSYAGTGTISGPINESAGPRTLTKVGGGKIVSTAANGYTGPTSILAGTLNIQHVQGLSGAGVTVANNATLELEGGLNMPAEALSLTGQGVGSFGALRSISGNNTWNGAITSAGIARITADAGLLTLNGAITLPAPGTNNQLVLQGAGNIEVNASISDNLAGATPLTSSANGNGTRTLNVANTYTGATNVNGGLLVVKHAEALGSTSGGTLCAGENNGGGSLVLTGGLTIAGEPLTLAGRQGSTIDTPHLVSMSGNNTWTGDVTFTTGGLDYNIESQAGLLTLSGQISGGAITNVRKLKLSGAGDGLISGAISNGTAGTLVRLTKLGTGSWTLTGANTYSGDTWIDGGTLSLAATGQMRFVPTTDGVNNSVGGLGTFVADGKFFIDLAAADATDGNWWVLINDLDMASPASYGETFQVDSSLGAFAEVADGVWEITRSRKTWTFEENTGELSVADGPGDDYDDWSDENQLVGGPDDDDDGDGRTNFEEYAFGLDPNSGSSVNPISQPLDKATGQFKYTRRATPATSGVSYTYESSLGLQTWPAFTPVSELSNNASPVEEITVTVPADLLVNPALFLRVKAVKP